MTSQSVTSEFGKARVNNEGSEKSQNVFGGGEKSEKKRALYNINLNIQNNQKLRYTNLNTFYSSINCKKIGIFSIA